MDTALGLEIAEILADKPSATAKDRMNWLDRPETQREREICRHAWLLSYNFQVLLPSNVASVVCSACTFDTEFSSRYHEGDEVVVVQWRRKLGQERCEILSAEWQSWT